MPNIKMSCSSNQAFLQLHRKNDILIFEIRVIKPLVWLDLLEMVKQRNHFENDNFPYCWLWLSFPGICCVQCVVTGKAKRDFVTPFTDMIGVVFVYSTENHPLPKR